MKLCKGFSVSLLLLCFCKLSAQDFSNKGKDFWVGYGYHQAMSNNALSVNAQDMVLYFTSDVNASVKVEIPAVGYVKNYTVTANAVTESQPIPKSGAQDARLLTEGIYNTGIHITSDKPVVTYAHIYNQSQSGATLLFPTNTLGQDYYSLNFTQRSNDVDCNSFAFVVATEDSTAVEITPSANTLTHTAGTAFIVNLNKGQIYNLMGQLTNNVSPPYTGVDLTGTRIRAVSTTSTGCKKIAVYSGSGRISIFCDVNATSSDNLIQQVFPRSAWGKKYLTAPTAHLTNNYFRIAVTDPATVVKINGVTATGLVNNFYYEISGANPNSIVSDKPVMVAQYITSTNPKNSTATTCNNTFNSDGDPEMIILSPIEQTIDKITLNSTSHNAITSHYINVIIKAAAVSSFRLDNAAVSSFAAHPQDAAYSYAVLTVNAGTHSLKADSGFNAIAYGYGSYESYGYNAGTNIKDLYQFLTLQNQYATVNEPATCKGTPFLFSITLPYQPTALTWDFGGNANLSPNQNVIINNPVPDSIFIRDGRTLNVYKLPSVYSFSAIGTYAIKILADNPTSGGCSGQQEIDYDVEVFASPTANFSISHSGCLSDAAIFTDASNGNGKPLIKWLWNFGDNTTDTATNPVKQYTTAGTYNVNETVVNNIGCAASVTKPFVIAPQAIAKFGVSPPTCAGSNITFHDSSIISSGSIVKWYWNFGNGDSITTTTNAPVNEIYATPGTFIVTLRVENNSGCKSLPFQKTIVVNAAPVVNFTLPKVCVNDAFAFFTDSSYVPGNSSAVLTHTWNYGDLNATVSNPNTSTSQNGQHHYTFVGPYTVTSTVSYAGCTSVKSQSFVVNSSNPVVNFTVPDSSNICSNEIVQIQDSSYVAVGTIARIEIVWDAVNNPAVTVIDTAPAIGKIYPHSYPASATNVTYQVKVRAYSGLTCVNEKMVALTVKASPKVAFAPVTDFCLSDKSRNITEATETTGLTCCSVFSGDGVSATGLFSPQASGVGEHTIKYVFTSGQGCSDSALQNIKVIANPTVNLPAEIFVLQGGTQVLQPVLTGNVSNYLWSPDKFISSANTQNPIITPTASIVYKLVVSTVEGCSDSDKVSVIVLEAPIIPTAFSPNGDGINDVWNIKSLSSYPECSVEVFNRWGQKVFESFGYAKPWDGTRNGTVLPVGVYYYIINPKQGRQAYVGNVTILK